MTIPYRFEFSNLSVIPLLFLTIIMAFTLTHPGAAQAQLSPNCEADKICVYPGNFLKYHTSSFGNNSTFTINFEGLVDPDNIRVLTTTTTDNGTIPSDNILNLRNGTLFSNDGTSGQFRYIAPTPINPNTIGQQGIKPEIVSFQGSNRMALGYHFNNGTNIFNLVVDNQTGVLLNFDALNTISNDQLVGASVQLVETNMFTNTQTYNTQTSTNPQTPSNSQTPSNTQTLNPQISNSQTSSNVQTGTQTSSNVQTGTQTSSNVQTGAQTSSIPSWIKIVAQFWSRGTVSDNEFVQGMQYLLRENILKVPQGTQSVSQSHMIPQWVRHNAGWWAYNEISDDEFLKGIQYLITNGIISV